MEDHENKALRATWHELSYERAMWRGFNKLMVVCSITNVSLLMLLLASPIWFGLQGTIIAAALFLGSLISRLIFTVGFASAVNLRIAP